MVPMTTRRDGGVFAVLCLIALAGNSSLFAPYHLYGDEYVHYSKSVPEWLATMGLWRIAGMMVPKWLVQLHLYGIFAIAVHAANGYLLYLIMQRASGRASFALLLAVVFVAFPWGYEVLAWSACIGFAVATLCSLFVIYLLVRPGPRRRWALAAVVFVLAFVGLLFSEAAFFVFCGAGAAVLVRRDVIFRRDFILAAAPLAGAATWAVLYRLLESASPQKQIASINPRSVFSGIYYQYSNLEVFDVWRLPELREYAFSTIGSANLTLAILLVCALVPLIWLVLKRADLFTIEPLPAGRFALFAVIMLHATTSIYVLGGGYTLDSKKRYLVVLYMILAAGATGRWLWRRFGRSVPIMATRWSMSTLIILLVVAGSATSLMMMSLWQRELARMDKLLSVIVANNVKGPITVEWNPYLLSIWPRAERSWGVKIDEDWVLSIAFRYGYGTAYIPVTRTAQGDRRLIWDGHQMKWLIRDN